MQQVLPWQELVDLIAPYAPEGRKRRPPFPVEMLLRIHFMQQWFNLSDPAMKKTLHDLPLFREFVGLSWGRAAPDESTILRFRHLLETHKLAEQILKTVTHLLESKSCCFAREPSWMPY
jgi:IS5 family transposase